MDAQFVRVVGQEGVFKLRNGKVVRIPLSRFSQDDLDYIRQKLADEGIRVWTDIDGRQVHAQFLRLADEAVYFRVGGKVTSVPFEKLSIADRRFVRQRMQEKGQTGNLPSAMPDEDLPPLRTWSDTDCNQVEAQLDRVAGKRVLLCTSELTQVIDIGKLTDADHDYLREQLEPQGLAHLVPAKPQPVEPPPTHVVTTTESDEAEPMETSSPEVAILTPPPLPPLPPPATPATHSTTPNPPPQSRVASPAPPASRAALPTDYVAVCGSCNKEVPSHLGAGDRCPHCRVKWDYEEDASGNLRDRHGNAVSPWVKWSGGAGSIVAIILIVLRVFSYFKGSDD